MQRTDTQVQRTALLMCKEVYCLRFCTPCQLELTIHSSLVGSPSHPYGGKTLASTAVWCAAGWAPSCREDPKSKSHVGAPEMAEQNICAGGVHGCM